MLLIKEYQCDNRTPSDEEIREGMQIAAEEHCIVRLNWFFPYSGHYHLNIKEDMTFEDCKAKLPRVYGV